MRKTTKTILLSIVIILLCSGCWGEQQTEQTNLPDFHAGKDVSQAQEVIDNSTKEIKTATTDITQATQLIREEANKTKGKIPPEVKKQIDPYLDKINESSISIDKNTQIINTAVAELAGAGSLLTNAGEKISNIETALDDVTGERDAALTKLEKLENDRDASLHKALRYLIVGCILLTGVFAVLFVLHGSKFGLTGAAICAVVCAIAIFVEAYFIYVAIAGGLILLGLIGALVYQIIVRNRAFKEVVDTVEVAQDSLDPAAKDRLFGGNGETGMMDTIQSPGTMALVKKEKEKMGNLWSYVKRKNGDSPEKAPA